MAFPIIYLPNELSKSLRRGHPWVYRDRLPRDISLPSGTWVQIQCGKLRAYGLWDAHSPIAVRVFSHNRAPDRGWVMQRIRQAWELRQPLRSGRTTAYRWVYGEGDGLPGLVVDLYGAYAVIETYAKSVESILNWAVDGLRACAPLKGVLYRGEHDQALWGRRPEHGLIVEENGLCFHVDPLAGQKTGLYLDHRDNRAFLERWAEGRQVLDCFSYTGAFALYALRGGARQVVSVDIAAPAIEQARRNRKLNGFSPDDHPCLVADCFDLLDEYAKPGRRFDLVILDPPSLARTRARRHAALRAYERLNCAAMRCVEVNGLLATASCTSQVSPGDFVGALADAAVRADRSLRILHESGHALDHPVSAHFPEGRYLKFVLGRVEEKA